MGSRARQIGWILGASAAIACSHKPRNHQQTTASTPTTLPPIPTVPVPISTTTEPSVASAPETNHVAQTISCNEQAPQEFLVNAHFNGRSLESATARVEWKAAVARSIRYRTGQFGYYDGFGSYSWNTKSLASQIHSTKFFGLPVRMHEKIIPALHCVEQALRSECANAPYQPRALSGVRVKNTYLDGDVSNHVYGIAIDIDPLQNPCCGCIEPWRSSPRCQGKKTDFERMDMPACWIGVFERFGFYWLGHDELKDTMHFEFLGDPDKIKKAEASP